MPRRHRRTVEEYAAAVLACDRVGLSQAITLIESQHPTDQALAQALLKELLPHTGKSIRVGITGVPGVGKSTFIEALGQYVIAQQHKQLAVLAVDPSSQRSRGSIMGDKTRMAALAQHPKAYIRPSPSQNTLGGVGQRTRETMLLCEAAGFEVIFIETVGVGQSETLVASMVDFFLLLMLAGAGDELQGIKKGIMEMADAIAITKADGDNLHASRVARAEYANALHLFPPALSGWQAPVLTCSALTGEGISEIWQTITRYQAHVQASGYLEQHRRAQAQAWFYEIIRHTLERDFYAQDFVQAQLPSLLQQIAAGSLNPSEAAARLLNK